MWDIFGLSKKLLKISRFSWLLWTLTRNCFKITSRLHWDDTEITLESVTANYEICSRTLLCFLVFIGHSVRFLKDSLCQVSSAQGRESSTEWSGQRLRFGSGVRLTTARPTDQKPRYRTQPNITHKMPSLTIAMLQTLNTAGTTCIVVSARYKKLKVTFIAISYCAFVVTV